MTTVPANIVRDDIGPSTYPEEVTVGRMTLSLTDSLVDIANTIYENIPAEQGGSFGDVQYQPMLLTFRSHVFDYGGPGGAVFQDSSVNIIMPNDSAFPPFRDLQVQDLKFLFQEKVKKNFRGTIESDKILPRGTIEIKVEPLDIGLAALIPDDILPFDRQYLRSLGAPVGTATGSRSPPRVIQTNVPNPDVGILPLPRSTDIPIVPLPASSRFLSHPGTNPPPFGQSGTVPLISYSGTARRLPPTRGLSSSPN